MGRILAMPDISQAITIPDKPQTLVNSSSVIGYSYNEATFELFVWFHGKGKAQPIYRYLMCFPPMFSSIFQSGGSIGKKISQLKALPKMKLR
jgi:hypothetical protein